MHDAHHHNMSCARHLPAGRPYRLLPSSRLVYSDEQVFCYSCTGGGAASQIDRPPPRDPKLIAGRRPQNCRKLRGENAGQWNVTEIIHSIFAEKSRRTSPEKPPASAIDRSRNPERNRGPAGAGTAGEILLAGP